jgi:hypothetical protein
MITLEYSTGPEHLYDAVTEERRWLACYLTKPLQLQMLRITEFDEKTIVNGHGVGIWKEIMAFLKALAFKG